MCLHSDIIDTTGLTIDANLKADMILQGYTKGKEFIEEIQELDI